MFNGNKLKINQEQGIMEVKRFRFYREHKYVIDMFIDFQQLAARCDFRDQVQVDKVITEFDKIVVLIECHAEHEDKAILELLKSKGSTVYESNEADHRKQHFLLLRMIEDLKILSNLTDNTKRIAKGYQFYLDYLEYFGDSLKHMHAEETVIMPELHRLCTDDELMELGRKTYDIMTPIEILHMIRALFQHFNADDIDKFLSELNFLEPDKLAKVWLGISELMGREQEQALRERFNLVPSKEKLDNETVLYYAWEDKPEDQGEVVLTQHQRVGFDQDEEKVNISSNEYLQKKEEYLKAYYKDEAEAAQS
jgi:hemerythrin-like domain-containing protein